MWCNTYSKDYTNNTACEREENWHRKQADLARKENITDKVREEVMDGKQGWEVSTLN